MKQPKPKSRKPKVRQTKVLYGFKRKNGRLVVDPRKKKVVQKLYGKFATDPEFLMKAFGYIAEWWHEMNSQEAKKEYQQRQARQQRGGK